VATNPQFPPNMPRRGPREVPRLQLLKKKSFPWTLLAIVVAAAILAAIIYWLPQTPRASNAPAGADIPSQPTGSQVQFSGFKLNAAPVGNAFYLDGQLSNHGTTEITGVQVQVNFLGNNGQVVGSETRPVGELSSHADLKSENLVDRPIKPNETRPIRIYVEHAPAAWNHQLPELTVTEVTATKP
jgi:Protein of unknown function (DUF2393)